MTDLMTRFFTTVFIAMTIQADSHPTDVAATAGGMGVYLEIKFGRRVTAVCLDAATFG